MLLPRQPAKEVHHVLLARHVTFDLQVMQPRFQSPKVGAVRNAGGLHNAVVTETGQVYTWGCNDDGSLGREGNEGFPALVESIKGL